MSRIPGWAEEQDVASNYPLGEGAAGDSLKLNAASRWNGITRAMVDEAVVNTVRRQQLGPEQADAFTGLASRDVHSGAATAFYSSKVAMARAAGAGVGRPVVHLREALTDEEVSSLTSYAPEYRLVFDAAEGHDHALASAARKLDHRIIWSRLPAGVRVTDVGGNPMVYILDGGTNYHVCGPSVDVKDPGRHVLRALQAKKLAKSGVVSEATRSLAKAYIAGDSDFVCNKVAQDCAAKADVIIAVHVYDVPLPDWPAIMESKGASCVEGCLLFSHKIYEETSGVLGFSGAQYEVDAGHDRFRMGFKNSPAWWYDHSWTSYLQYGTDHLFQQGDHYYSYKVVERRGDTLFYRILRCKGEAPVGNWVARRSPVVDLVRVDGFELDENTARRMPMRRRQYFFPRKLWYEMVSQASEDYERGVMDFSKMYRYYRTVSVRQTINAVLVIGGEPVTADELVPLVVHACLAAASAAVLGQRETRSLTSAILTERKRQQQPGVAKLLSFVAALAVAPALVVFWPLTYLSTFVRKVHASVVEDWLLSWEPVVSHVRIPMHVLSRGGIQASGVFQEQPEEVFVRSAREGAMFDAMAGIARNPGLVDLFSDLCPAYAPKRAVSDVERASVSVPPTYHTDGLLVGGGGAPSSVTRQVVDDRLAAVREHLVEIEEAQVSNRAHCAKAYAYLFSMGVPRVNALQACDDEYGHPDAWQVVEGVLVKSVRGMGREDFSHSAVYAPGLGLAESDPVRSVLRTVWDPPPGSTESQHVNYIIEDSQYTGYVLVCDALSVYNGEDVRRSMVASLELPHDYVVSVTQAPAGCGKTYAIKQKMRTSGEDVFACPVRESALSTRTEFVLDNPGMVDSKLRMRTVDSYLTNYFRDKKTQRLTAGRLLADEVYMTHAGRWYAMAALLGVSEVDSYGDEKQIPHIPRVRVPALHVKMRAQVADALWRNYRNPASAVAAWGHVYDHKVRAVSGEKGYFDEAKDGTGRQVVKGTVMMCMYQADKTLLRKLYSHLHGRVKIMTAHESEGKTFDHVWLHKFDTRVRTDKSSLFDSEPHCLVAASRHRVGFLYVNPGVTDLVSHYVQRSKDPRRVMAAKDLATAGVSKEYV